MKSGLNQYFEQVLLSPPAKFSQPAVQHKAKVTRRNSNKITLSQYFEKELLEETSADERMQQMTEDNTDSISRENSNGEEEEEEVDIYTSYASYMSSSDPGSDNLLVTFDYGFQDSEEADLSINSQQHESLDPEDDLNKNLFKIPEESSEDLLAAKHIEMYSKSPNIFKVHQIQHANSNTNTRTSSCISVATSLVEYNIDTSGDYGSWAQSESEQENGDDESQTYRYEDLIKKEDLINDDDDGNDTTNGNDGREVLIKFDFNEDVPPRWFNTTNNINNNEHLYYRSLDYLN